MSKPLSQLLDETLNENGFRAKGNYANATSQDERQMLRIANRAVSYIMHFPWARQRRFHEFTLTSDTTYDLPADFQGLVPDTVRANSRVMPVDVNTTPGTWAWLKSRSGTGGVEYRTRWFRDSVEFFRPNPGDVITLEYYSSHPINDVGGTPKAKFTADSDVWLMDEDLLTWEILWRFLKAKGLPDWQDTRGEARSYFKEYVGRQAPPKSVNLVQGGDYRAGEPYTDLYLD